MTDHRRERGRRNRAALVESALDLFEANGFDATTVEQIAERAGVAPRTFFHHFPSKEDVLFDGYADRLAEVGRRLRSGGDRSMWAAMADVASAVAHAILEDPGRYLTRAGLYDRVPALRARMLRINEEWIDSVTREMARKLDVDPDIDVRPRLAATLLNGANRVAIQIWCASDGSADLRLLMADTVELLRPTIDLIEGGLYGEGTGRAS